MPRAAPGVLATLDRCDELVAQAGGRVYLTKDARLRPAAIEAMYPRLPEWRAARDRADPERLWRSDLALRTGLVAQDHAGASVSRAPDPRRTASGQLVPRVNGSAHQRLLLIGGSSEIALAVARRLAADGPVKPFLLGRDRARLEEAASSLLRAGTAPGEVELLDADDLPSHETVIGDAFARSGGFDVVLLAVGVLGAQQGLDADPATAAEVMRVNFVGCGSLLLNALRQLRAQGSGTLVVLSSVAAERARAGNAVYGAAKTGLDALAQGLGDATAGSGVRVLVVRPGFVASRMTAGLPPAPFATTPEAVADATVRALAGRAHTIWVPARLRYVFALLRHLPRPVYRRLPL
jgi:decaprenylphospho-beta-D-erythro-pentofuranosid-2-ulose 2-reductase